MNTVWIVSLGIVSIAILGCLYRVIKGPSMADRIIALDTIGINLLAAVAIIGAMLKTGAFFETILLIGILTFLGTTAFARFIERGVVFENGNDENDK